MQGFPWKRPSPDQLPSEALRLSNTFEIEKCMSKRENIVWIATSYESVKNVLTSKAVSSDFSHPCYPDVFPFTQKRRPNQKPKFLTYSAMDGDQHISHRRRTSKDFTKFAINKHSISFDEIASQLMADFLTKNKRSELVSEYIRPFVIRSLAHFFQIPTHEVEQLSSLSNVILGDSNNPEKLLKASNLNRKIVTKIIERKTENSGSDPISKLIKRYKKEGIYNLNQMITLGTSILTAGLETTTNTISISFFILLKNRDVIRSIKTNPTLLPIAIEELLRLTSVADIVTARATIDCLEINNIQIVKNSGIVASTASANRDPSVFKNPQVFDINRQEKMHLAFGHGQHKCLGQHLARILILSAIKPLCQYSSDIRLTEPMENAYVQTHGVMPGLSALFIQ